MFANPRVRELLSIGAACLVAWFAFKIVPSPEPTSAEWAAWVQAVGSVGAIAAGFALANRQAWEAQRAEWRRAETAQQIAMMSSQAILRRTEDRIERAVDLLRDGETRKVANIRIAEYSLVANLDVLAKFDIYAVQHPGAIAQWSDFVGLVSNIVETLREARAVIAHDADPAFNHLVGVLNAYLGAFQKARQIFAGGRDGRDPRERARL